MGIKVNEYEYKGKMYQLYGCASLFSRVRYTGKEQRRGLKYEFGAEKLDIVYLLH